MSNPALPYDKQSHLQEIISKVGDPDFCRYICSADFGLFRRQIKVGPGREA
jgi:hypothetical protein